ncbi:hypothetical protein ABZZ74_23680 [Streptomyces sp. NPDC006476]|uniref:hypothetical protein n=1 Tax=Streptomyces sp. NPDC006476 TaxID=3157175 RepID=UPI0033BAD1EF
MAADLLATSDPEAAAFFADARAALTPKPAPSTPEFELPADWPITPHHRGPTLTRSELHARRGHALRISYDWIDGRQAMWVGRWRGGDWSILQGYEGKPASLLTSPHSWDNCLRQMDDYLTEGRAFGGENLTVDEWLPGFAIVCLAHGEACGDHEDRHNFARRRTMARYPEGTYRPCGGSRAGVLGGGGHDGIYRYRFQVEGRWRLRFGCRSHHAGLLAQHLDEADSTVTVQLMDDHITR